MEEIQIVWADGRSDTLAADEIIYADRSAGQWENGFIAYRLTNEREEYFISEAGRVYIFGTGFDVGVAPEIEKACNENERKLDELYAQGGM